MILLADGRLSCGCSDPYAKRILGDARLSSIEGVWTGPVASSLRADLNQGGSKVESGNLLTLPVGGGLLYVQPVYVRATGETSYPLLQYVFVAFGGDEPKARAFFFNQAVQGNRGGVADHVDRRKEPIDGQADIRDHGGQQRHDEIGVESGDEQPGPGKDGSG